VLHEYAALQDKNLCLLLLSRFPANIFRHPLHMLIPSPALPQAEAMVAGYANPVHKSFKTRQEAENFLAQHSSGSGKAYGTVRGPDGEATGERQL
jgi:hypothetical protein